MALPVSTERWGGGEMRGVVGPMMAVGDVLGSMVAATLVLVVVVVVVVPSPSNRRKQLR